MLHIPVAIPGAGKSHLAEVYNAMVVSTDAIREELTKDVNNQERNGDVFAEFHKRIRLLLALGYPVYADATNLTGRGDLRKIAADLNVKTHLILFRNPVQAIERNQKRDRQVPAEVMFTMISRYEQAVLAVQQEHYDFVTEVSSVG